MAPQPRFVVAEGHLFSTVDALAAGLDDSRFVFQFRSKLVLCDVDERVGTFVNNVKCRKWTDLSGNTASTHVLPGVPEPPQPGNGCIVNVGEVTITIEQHAPPPQTIVCPNFQLEGTQTHRTEGGLAVFLFTGKGDAVDGARVTGVGSCLERLVPKGRPFVDSWHFVFTICP